MDAFRGGVPDLASACGVAQLFSNGTRLERVIEECEAYLVTSRRDLSDSLVVKIAIAFRHERHASKQAFCLLGHGHDQIAFFMQVFGWKIRGIEFFLPELMLEAARFPEVAGRKNYELTRFCKILTLEREAMFDMDVPHESLPDPGFSVIHGAAS